jgi:cbb3-type cytochrome oxidase subunit 3
MGGFILFVLIFISVAWFLHEPRPKMAFAVSEARLRIDGAYAVRANNL